MNKATPIGSGDLDENGSVTINTMYTSIRTQTDYSNLHSRSMQLLRLLTFIIINICLYFKGKNKLLFDLCFYPSSSLVFIS